LALLRGLNGINIVGADVVEVAPAYDHADITTVAAATLVFDLLALMVNRSKAESNTVRELQAASWNAS
jgi:agmatinase